jgi:tRNA modification GTPase
VSDQATLAACTTPPGTAALAAIELRGPEAWAIACSLFKPRGKDTSLPEAPQRGQFWLGRFGSELAQEVVLTLRQTEPFPWLEIMCHGGREAIRMLLETLEAHGIRIFPWSELEQRTTDNSLNAQIITALPEALTLRTAGILLDQLHGAFARARDNIIAAIQSGDHDAAASQLNELNRHSALGQHLTKPWRVTIGGAPNVGKSSLVNAIAGYERCIVAPTPGTTRDVVTTTVAIEGWPIEFADTAGLREGAESVEEIGIEQARRALTTADLCLWVVDGSADPVWPDTPLSAVRSVVNKIDLPCAWSVANASGALRVSALTREGVADLCAFIARRLVPDPPPPGSAVPFTEALGVSVAEALNSLSMGDVSKAIAALQRADAPS